MTQQLGTAGQDKAVIQASIFRRVDTPQLSWPACSGDALLNGGRRRDMTNRSTIQTHTYMYLHPPQHTQNTCTPTSHLSHTYVHTHACTRMHACTHTCTRSHTRTHTLTHTHCRIAVLIEPTWYKPKNFSLTSRLYITLQRITVTCSRL